MKRRKATETVARKASTPPHAVRERKSRRDQIVASPSSSASAPSFPMSTPVSLATLRSEFASLGRTPRPCIVGGGRFHLAIDVVERKNRPLEGKISYFF